ncbi:hypothetical protein EDF42_0413 [Curtobacterium sp. PhB172]|nr:hypothetical protein EDF42_0413 [Curtobacterium sp. PhB172]
MRGLPYLPAPVSTPFAGAPRSFAPDPEPRRRRTPDPWADFEAWCTRRGIGSLPASGAVVASYLLDRSRDVDDTGALAHSPGRLQSWIDVIDAKHVAADLPRVRLAPPVPAVLSTLIRYRKGECQSFQAVRTLEAVLEAIECSLKGAEKDRARALLLIGAVGGLTYASLKALRFGDVLADPGDGLRVSTSSADTTWIPVTRQAELCPACAFVRWCAHTAPRKEPAANAGQFGHVCLIAAISSPAGLEKSPLFRRVGTNEGVNPQPRRAVGCLLPPNAPGRESGFSTTRTATRRGCVASAWRGVECKRAPVRERQSSASRSRKTSDDERPQNADHNPGRHLRGVSPPAVKSTPCECQRG